VLPYVVAGTILIETIAISFIPKINKPFKTFCVVTFGNVISYLIPYVFVRFVPYFYGTYGDFIEHVPVYNVGIAFLVLTIVVELPFNYFLLHKNTENPRKLFWTILIANAVTTGLVAYTERLICAGQW
jgi:hypothetical protein